MKIQKIEAQISGISDIMFDKFVDYSEGDRPPEQKLYLDDNNTAVLPAENLLSFLVGEYPSGCCKKFEGRKGKSDYIPVVQSHVFFSPVLLPFTADGKIVKFKKFGDKFRIFEASPRVRKGGLSIKTEMTKRPILTMPWELSFTINLIENTLIDENKLHNWFDDGGILVSIGTYRPRFGRFAVTGWKPSD